MTIKGKTALITGASKRIGRAIALALGAEGVNIVIHYGSSANEAESLARELADLGVKSWVLQADFSNPDEYKTLVSQAIKTAGSLDILVNNASIFPNDKIEDMTFEGLMSNMQVNAWVPFYLSREFARLGGKGKIINMLDSRIQGYDWAHVSYILSKHVISVLTSMMALEFAPNVTVNGVSPGLILPPPGKDESYIERLTDTVPMKKHGEPEDVAGAVVYLAKSDFLTGEVIFVDGGRHLKEFI